MRADAASYLAAKDAEIAAAAKRRAAVSATRVWKQGNGKLRRLDTNHSYEPRMGTISPSEQRILAALLAFGELTTRQIAERTGLTMETAKASTAYLKAKLIRRHIQILDTRARAPGTGIRIIDTEAARALLK